MPLIGKLMNVPVDCIHVDELVRDGGLRQRPIREGGHLQESILTKGFVPDIGRMSCFEVIDEDGPRPLHALHTNWSRFQTIDLSNDESIRKFFVIDGNQRVHILRQIMNGTLQFLHPHHNLPAVLNGVAFYHYYPEEVEELITQCFEDNAPCN